MTVFWLIHSVCNNRIVVHGERFASTIVPSSAKPFNFQMEYGLTEKQVMGSVCVRECKHVQKQQKYFKKIVMQI